MMADSMHKPEQRTNPAAQTPGSGIGIDPSAKIEEPPVPSAPPVPNAPPAPLASGSETGPVPALAPAEPAWAILAGREASPPHADRARRATERYTIPVTCARLHIMTV